MRKPFLLSLLVALLTSLSIHAYDFQSGDLYYKITSGTTVEVSASNYQGLTTATIPETVTYNGTTYSVTSIGSIAFKDCSSLTSITIPNSVTSIGDEAFYWCSSLTSITLPNSVTSIGDEAFYWCSSLTSITIPNSVTSIGYGAFYGCTSLPVVDNLRYADTYLVEAVDKSLSTYTIKAETKWIGGSAFSGCSSLTSLTLPNSVTSIGGSAFSGCSSLTSLTLPNSVTSIGGSAFRKCSSLTSITIGNSVTSIGDYAFEDCSALTSITIPNSVTSIGQGAFEDCSALTSITIPNSVTSIGSRAFSGCSSLTSVIWNAKNCAMTGGNYYEYAPFYYSRANITSFTFGEEVETIPSYLCYDMSSLTSISIGNSVTCIGDWAFYDCASLTSITLPNSVTSIRWRAFSSCSSLISITIGNSVTSIGERAFSGCSSLTSITLPNSVTSIGDGAFEDCSSLVKTNYIGDIASWCNIQFTNYTANPISFSKNLYLNDVLVTDLVIPQSVIGVGDYAFYNCSSLTSVTLPNSVTSIGVSAFYSCSSLTSVTSLSCTPPSCGSDVFNYTPSEKTLVVPSISMDAYKNSSTWEDFTSFEKCLSVFVQSSDSTLGIAQIDQEVDCDSVAIISAVGNPGSTFTQWSDGNTDNPRTIKLTQDTTFVAEFEMDYSGKCGDELYWAYSNQEIKITGTGAMYNYTDSTMPWTLLRDSILTVRVGNNATSIGEYAFANTPKLAKLHIGTNVEDIGANAFAGCKRLYDIYCYPTYPPFAETNSFANYNVYIYVPCENLRDYTLNVVWGEFKFIECIGSEDVEVSGNEVTVSPDYEDATFTWAVTDGADTYSLVITKGGVTFCTLVFNAQGQLVSIAFKPRRQNAPAAEGTTPATYAEMTANGFRFTVTGLDEGSAYAYTLTVRNAANTVLETYTGDFTTLSNTPTGINESAGEDAHGQVEKIIRDGQVLILRNGETYNMMGQTP